METRGNSECLNLMKDVSPVAWSHIILQGRFKFKESKEHIDIEAIIKELELKFSKN
jgi:hypothetical protein